MTTRAILATATALLLPMPLLANEPVTFAGLDADGSGAVDAQEARAHSELEAKFELADRDGNGELSQQEFTFAMARIRIDTELQRQRS